MGRAWVGTSGWQYKHWRGRFYPETLPQKRWFEHYAGAFDTVEINNTFYRHPALPAWDGWEAQAPPGFRYVVKANRFITHIKRMKDVADPLARFYDAAGHLNGHLGPLLFQLRPDFRATAETYGRLAEALELFPRQLPHAIEFRHESWFCDATYELLRRHGVALCIADWETADTPRVATGPFVYWRFHGVTGRYAGSYTPAMLRTRAAWIREVADGRDSWIFFNNDDRAYAVENALQLRDLL